MANTSLLVARKVSQPRELLAGLLGNVLDHYDTALYGFLAPFIAPLIFHDQSFVAALIKTYGLMSTSLITRPLGAWYFGRYGARYGAKQSLSLSLSGLTLVTFLMGILPTYDHVGEAAPFFLAILRLLQGFFGAGESTIAPFFILRTVQKRRGLLDSILGSTTVFGEILASLAALAVGLSSAPEFCWRWPFLISATTALVSIYLRQQISNTDVATNVEEQHHFWPDLKQYRINFLRVIAVSGMSYITYSAPFIFFNNFIPQISAITYTEMMMLNTSLLILDMAVAPLFGWLADCISHARFMFTMSLILSLVIVPLFYFLPGASLSYVSFVRIVIVLTGLGFCAPLHAWFMTQFSGRQTYLLTGLAYAIGSQTFGRSMPAIGLYLWSQTQITWSPALFIMLVSGLACVALFDDARRITPQ